MVSTNVMIWINDWLNEKFNKKFFGLNKQAKKCDLNLRMMMMTETDFENWNKNFFYQPKDKEKTNLFHCQTHENNVAKKNEFFKFWNEILWNKETKNNLKEANLHSTNVHYHHHSNLIVNEWMKYSFTYTYHIWFNNIQTYLS